MSASSVTMPFPARLRTALQVDPVLLTLVLALLLGGFVILASAAISVSDKVSGDPFFYLQRQLVAAAIGLGAGVVCLFIPLQFWRTLGPLMLLGGIVLLVLVLIPGIGVEVNGSTRWIRLGFINLQVSEPARLCFLLYLAGYLVRRNKSLREELTGFLRPMVVMAIACTLLLAEPDFGAAVVLLATAMAMMFVAGARLRDFLLFFVLSVVAMGALAVASPYRMQRLTGPSSIPGRISTAAGFQLTQSLIAIGRGEWFGVGLGDSVQKLFLPAGGPYRLCVRRVRRRVRPVRFVVADRPVPGRGVARFQAGDPRGRCRVLFRGLRCRRYRYLARYCRHSSTSASTWACCRPRA